MGWLVTSCPLGNTFIFLWPLPRAGPKQRCSSSVRSLMLRSAPPMLVVFPSVCNAMALSIQWSGCHRTTSWGMHRFTAGIAEPQESHVHLIFSSFAPSPCDRTRRVREKRQAACVIAQLLLPAPPIQRLSQASLPGRRAGGGRFV